MTLNPVDGLVVLIILLGAFSGWSRGFVFAALDLLTPAASLLVAFLGYRMSSAKVGYLAAGENFALAPTLAGAHQGLMNSPGHRANILRPQFGRLGVGVLDGGVHGLMVTQNFSN